MTEYYSLFFIRKFYEWIAFYICKFEFEWGFGSYSMSGMAQLRFRLRLGWWYSVFVHFQEQILFGIWTFFMNEYYSVFGIRRISWTNIIRYSVFGSFSWTNTIRYSVFGNSSWTNIFGIRYSVKFTIRCNSATYILYSSLPLYSILYSTLLIYFILPYLYTTPPKCIFAFRITPVIQL